MEKLANDGERIGKMIDADMVKALRCLASQDGEGNCYEDIYNFMNPDKQRMRCGGDCFIPKQNDAIY